MIFSKSSHIFEMTEYNLLNYFQSYLFMKKINRSKMKYDVNEIMKIRGFSTSNFKKLFNN